MLSLAGRASWWKQGGLPRSDEGSRGLWNLRGSDYWSRRNANILVRARRVCPPELLHVRGTDADLLSRVFLADKRPPGYEEAAAHITREISVFHV